MPDQSISIEVPDTTIHRSPGYGALTWREREVMGFIVNGHSSKSIAERLLISVKTVEVHREHLMHKTGAKNVATLVRAAIAGIENNADEEFNLSDHSRLSSLTFRECEVMQLVVAGHSSKSIGRLLLISPRTVEVHRSRIMLKTGARSVAGLVRIAMSGTGDRSAQMLRETQP